MRHMKIFLFVCCFLKSVLACAASIEGYWITADDKTGKKRAVVQISKQHNMVVGTIKKVYPEPGDTGICQNCPGKFKNKPVAGLQFLWGLQPDGDNQWDNGRILDPKSGKIYRAKVTLKDNKLYVRGYLGVSLLGRTQVWTRDTGK